MANKKVKKTPKTKDQEDSFNSLMNQPWISMRMGLIVIAITSVAMAALTAIQTIPSVGVVKGILWGLLFGAMIWVIFYGYYFIRRFLGPKG